MVIRREHGAGAKLGRLGLFIVGMCVLTLAIHALHLTVNTTPSMPIGLYRAFPLNAGVVHRGDIVQVCPPAAIARVGRERGYLLAGSCATGSVPLLKIVVAVGGDDVVVGDRALIVRGTRLAAPRSTFDGQHRPLAQVARGTYVLRPDEMWVWSPYPGSWDSRYFGALPASTAIGRAQLLLAFQPWRFTEPSFIFGPTGR